MKRTKMLLFVLAVCLLLLCACAKPTPETPALPSREEPPTQEVVQETPAPEESEQDAAEDFSLAQVETFLRTRNKACNALPAATNEASAAFAQYIYAHQDEFAVYLESEDTWSEQLCLADRDVQYCIVNPGLGIGGYNIRCLRYTSSSGVMDYTQYEAPDVCDVSPEIKELLQNSRYGDSHDYVYYDLCKTDVEREAFSTYQAHAERRCAQYLSTFLHFMDGHTYYAIWSILADGAVSLSIYKDDMSFLDVLCYGSCDVVLSGAN